MSYTHMIRAEDLLPMIGTSACPNLVDISIEADFAADPFLIPGAIRHSYSEPGSLLPRLRQGSTVIICQKGKKLSQGLAAWLRTEGLDAKYLEGGNVGWRAHPGTLQVSSAALPKPVGDATLWVMAEGPTDDQLACAWLVRRFLDKAARTLFVAPSEVADVAQRYGAAHLEDFATDLAIDGRACRFAGMLMHFNLTCVPLQRIAACLQDRTPDAAGVRIVLMGLRQLNRDDLDLMEASSVIFDALYGSAAQTVRPE